MQSGPDQMRDWMRRRKFNQREAAAYLDFDETYLSQVLNEKRVPGLNNAVKIERFTGIPVESWMPSERGDMSSTVPDAPPQNSV